MAKHNLRHRKKGESMQFLIIAMIVVGSVIMITNIYRYRLYMKELTDVLSGGNKRDLIWQWIALFLLMKSIPGAF